MSSSAPPRRFRPEPVETSVKSSRNRHQEDSERAPRLPHEFDLDAVETTSKPRRKFVPEPVETTSKSTRKFAPEPVETTQRTHRRFAPQPVETTVKSNRENDVAKSEKPTRRKFNVEPVETTTRGNHKKEQIVNSSKSKPLEECAPNEKRPRRRFAPQLIETAKRTRKAGDTNPAVLPSDKTDGTPGDSAHSPRRARFRPDPESTNHAAGSGLGHSSYFLEIRRTTSPLARRANSRSSTRSHSFRVPELDPIESSESEDESAVPSLSTSPSADSDHSYMYKEATRMRETVDDRFKGYFLELAQKAAEKQLREQAMAAFPNSDFHEPVDHFIDRDSDDTEMTGLSTDMYSSGKFARRQSSTNWEMTAMRKHQEKRQQQEKEKEEKSQTQSNRGRQAYNPWGAPVDAFGDSNKNIVGWQKDGELDKMRSGARPPMLGSDIKFPRCSSPEPARFDPTQGSHAIRNSMCYLTEQSQAAESKEGLWSGKASPSSRNSFRSNASSRPPSRGGLWGGFCVGTQTPPSGPTGLMTPRIEIENPFEAPGKPAVQGVFPPSPPASNADMTSIDEKLATEATIDDEFGDDFITQVYNYLSLGYPSIARDFDEELSKISRIPIHDLRQDDHLAKKRGYIRLGADGNLKDTEITEESCMRWRALRLYVREWVRQQPRMVTNDRAPGGMLGTAIRRGSWAW